MSIIASCPKCNRRLSPLGFCDCGRDGSGRWPSGDLAERLLMRVEKTEDGCWKWAGYHDEDGRPRFCIDDHPRFAYRLLYEEVIGQVPDGLVLDHLCRHPWCMNPEHLEQVTSAENTRRHYKAQTHCRRGHLWDEENTVYEKRGRICKACRRESQRRYYERNDQMLSARAARDDGTQPAKGSRWGSEGSTGAWRDRVASGTELCRGCRARLLLRRGEYVEPGNKHAA